MIYNRFAAALQASLLLLAGTLWAADPTPPAQTHTLIKAKSVVTVEGRTFEPGAVLVAGNRVVAVGGNIAANHPDTNVVEYPDSTIYPGWFSMGTSIGLVEIDMVGATNDSSEGTGPFRPEARAIDAFNAMSSALAVTRLTGVAVVQTQPRGNIFSGQGAVMHLGGESMAECLVATPSALIVNLGEAGRGGEESKGGSPKTRMGSAAFVRGKFQEALEHRDELAMHRMKAANDQRELERYNAKKAKAEAENDQEALEDLGEPPLPRRSPDRDFQKEAVLEALSGKIPVIVNAHRLDDIQTALRIQEEFGFRLILSGATNAYKVSNVLAKRGIPVILNAMANPGGMEEQGAIYTNAKRLNDAGVLIAFAPDDNVHNVRNLPFEVGFLLSYGLPREAALRALTINPATMLGVEKEVGGIVEGKLANLIVVDGDPLSPASRIRYMMIAGREIPLTSRQTDLARQYLEDPTILP